MKSFLRLNIIVLLACLAFVSIPADEGMYPVSEIAKLNLKAKGLKIPVKEIYNPEGVSLVDAICIVGGGTGEFVSPDGLILTNHHIAFGATAQVSTPDHDYLKNGFVANTRSEELEAAGYVCKITESYRDVTTEIMSAATAGMSPADRIKAIRDKMKTLAQSEEAGRKTIACEVSEMFPGKSYVLFTYRLIRDVRLVYVPPLGVGEFGGEEDNWMWPRHNGDFSFLRAYVAPDGSSALYSKENIPFKPKRFLRISPKGVTKNDFVMMLGYPGRTFRHKISDYISLYEKTIFPFQTRRFDFLISTMQNASEGDRVLQLKFASLMKSYSNATKNYKGKMQGLRRTDLANQKRKDEQALQAFIESDPAAKAQYGSTLKELRGIYADWDKTALQEIMVMQATRLTLFQCLSTILINADVAVRSDTMYASVTRAVTGMLNEGHLPVDRVFVSSLLNEMSALPASQQPPSLRMLYAGITSPREIRTRIDEAVRKSVLADSSRILSLVSMNREEIRDLKDPIIDVVNDLATLNDELRARQRTREGELNRLEASLLEAKMLWQKKDFIPDANLTLRLTYGYIRGYSPADATSCSPQTTLRGIVEKNIGAEPYDAPEKLIALYKSKKYDKRFEDKFLKDVPVGMLYNMDTTGGNSGSPVLNAFGELVGVNFDRTFEATINDYKWSEEYSRSIGVDIRYILFVAKYVSGADSLLKELGVNI
jgi:hypothetical protein